MDDASSSGDTLAAISTATAAVRLVGAVLNTAGPHVKNAFSKSPTQDDADVTGISTRAVPAGSMVPIGPERETRAYETVNFVLRTMGSRILDAGLVNTQALATALTAATSHIEMRLFSVETNRLFQSLASKLNDATLVNSVFTCIYFLGFLLGEIKSSLPGYKSTYIPLGQRIVQQIFKVAIGEEAFQENREANLEAYKTLAATAGLLRPTDIDCHIFPDFPSFSPNRYSSKSFTDRSFHKSVYDKLTRHFEQFGFPQPLQGRDVGPIRDWRFLSSDTNSRSYEVEKADKFIGENFGRVLYWLVCSAHRMQSGMAVVAYYDQHLSLIRWFGARFGYRVIRAYGDLNMSGNHMQMTKKMRAIFDTWLIIMPSESGLAARQNAAQLALHQQQAQHAAAQSTARPHASTMQSTSSSSVPTTAGAPSTQNPSADIHHPLRASTMPSAVPQTAPHRLSVSESVASSDISSQQTMGGQHTGAANPAMPGTPSTMSPPMSPAQRPAQISSGKAPSRQSSTTSPMQSNASPEGTVSSASMQAPYHPKTVAMQKLEDVASTYNLTYVPLCNRFLQTQFSDFESMKREHSVITEGMMAQVILKLDDVDIQGDEVARIRRKGLIDEIQAALGKVDDRVRLASEAAVQIQAHHLGQLPAGAPAHASEAPPQPGISRVYTNPPQFHPTLNPAELSAGLGFVELPGSTHAAGHQTAPAQAELAADPPRKASTIRRKAPPPPKKVVVLATALYDFEPEEEGGEELSFKEGDIIEIVEKTKELEEDGWCRARIKGQRKLGLCPMDYIEELPNQPSLPSKPPSKLMAAVAEVEGENGPAPANPSNALGNKPLFLDQGMQSQGSPSNLASQNAIPQAAMAVHEHTQPTPSQPGQPSNTAPSATNQVPQSQSIQPSSLGHSSGEAPQPSNAALGLPQQHNTPETSTVTPPPPYAAIQEHANMVAGGSAAQYYDGHAHLGAAAEEQARGGKINIPTPPGITNPNHNAGTYFATHIFNRPQKENSIDGQMSPGDQTTMRSISATEMRPAAQASGGAPARPQSQMPGAAGPGTQGRPVRPMDSNQGSGSNMTQNANALGNILGGVGQILGATSGRNNNQWNSNQGNNSGHCGGCGRSNCGGCGSHGGRTNESTSVQEVNQTVNVSNTYQTDVSQQSVVNNVNPPVSPLEQPGQPTFESVLAPSNVIATSSSDTVQTGNSFLSSEPSIVSPSPLAGLSPLPDAGVSLSPGFSADPTISPLAGLVPATTGADTSYFASNTVPSPDQNGLVSPLAGLAVTESSQTTDLGGGMTETTTTAIAVDAQGGDVVATAVGTDVTGAPIGGGGGDFSVGVAVTEESTGGGWNLLGGSTEQSYGDSSGGGDWDF